MFPVGIFSIRIFKDDGHPRPGGLHLISHSGKMQTCCPVLIYVTDVNETRNIYRAHPQQWGHQSGFTTQRRGGGGGTEGLG